MIVRLMERSARRIARSIWTASRSAGLQAIHCLDGKDAPRVLPDKVRNIVAIRLDRLGDLVLTLPAIDSLARTFPGARLTVAVRPPYAALLDGRGTIDRVLTLHAGEPVRSLARQLRLTGAEMLVDFSAPDSVEIPRAAAKAGIPVRVGHAGGGREVFLTDPVPCRGSRRSMLEENSALVESLGGRRCTLPPSIPVPDSEREAAESHLRRAGAIPEALRIAVHPGGYYATQRYPVERFASAAAFLAERHGGKVVVLGGPADRELAEALYRDAGPSAVQLPTGSVMHLAAVLRCCDLLLANNSGPVHLAGAVGLPTVSLMGPTDPVRFTPDGALNRVLRRNDLACSPCGRGRCGPHECLLGIPEDSLVRAADRMIDALFPERGRRRCMGGGA